MPNKGRSPKECTVFAEGKTKMIWLAIGESDFGMVQQKSVVTAGDGKHEEHIPGKDISVTATTCNIFSLLNKHSIATHYESKVRDDMYLVRLLDMIPIEIVVRRIPYGSFLERNPAHPHDIQFRHPLVEFFYKNDTMSDPMMLWHAEHQCFRLYHSHEPPEIRGYIGELNAVKDPLIPHNENEKEHLETIALRAFLVLEEAFKHVGVTLVDFKIECGYDKSKKLYIGDQIDGDSCRLWKGGDKNKAVDKDRFRNIVKERGTALLMPEERKQIAEDYQRIAQMTSAFAGL